VTGIAEHSHRIVNAQLFPGPLNEREELLPCVDRADDKGVKTGIRQALAESRNAVAMWITEQIGIDSVLRISRSLGVRTRLELYPTTALGASAMTLLELANAYRTMASGIVAEPYIIRAIARDSGALVPEARPRPVPATKMVEKLSPLHPLVKEAVKDVVSKMGSAA
jgi:membrane peptidoglycan carboxypeptidase